MFAFRSPYFDLFAAQDRTYFSIKVQFNTVILLPFREIVNINEMTIKNTKASGKGIQNQQGKMCQKCSRLEIWNIKLRDYKVTCRNPRTGEKLHEALVFKEKEHRTH